MASPQDAPIHPLCSRTLMADILYAASSRPTQRGRAALEPIPPTPPSAAVSSTTTSIETASASPKHTSSYRTTKHKESDRAERSPQEPKPHIKGEKQQDSSCEESNMEGILVDIGDHMEADNDVGVSSGAGVGPGRYYPHKRPQMASSHRNLPRNNRISSDVTDSYKAQSVKLLDAEATIIEKNRQINALTETISRLHQRDGGTSRDDDYLTAQFSDITNSITAWTVSNFQKSLQEMITDLNKLPADLAQTVKKSVYDSTNILGSISSRRNIVNAVVVRAILHCMFKPFLFGAREAEDHLHAVSSQLQGTDYQIQRWRALTVNLLAQGPGYENKYDRELSLIAVTLSNLLAHLAPVESDTEARNAELHKILGRAAALSVEIHKQTDLICLSPVEPGALFESNFMEDLGYKYELHELDGKAVVQVPIFPAVIRRSCAPGGMLSEPYYVMKARVTTTFANQD